jgi:hypothetical protein
MKRRMFRDPTADEQAFLQIVSFGYAEISEQVKACQVAEYDPTGWCDVRILTGPPSPIRFRAPGAAIRRGDPENPEIYIDTILNVDVEGFLENVEILVYVGRIEKTPYEIFVKSAMRGELLIGHGSEP